MRKIVLVDEREETACGLERTLEAEGHDVLVISLPELIAGVHALMGGGRSELEPVAHRTIAFGDIAIDVDAGTVARRGEPVHLTPKEFDLLLALVRGDGTVLSRTALLRDVWGHRAEVCTRTVDVHVAELRRKLEDDPGNPRHLVTVWKRGYRLDR